MPTSYLLLKCASASRSSGQWSEDDYDVLADGIIVGRSFKANAAPVGTPWMWTLVFGRHEDRAPTHGYAADARGGDGGVREKLAATMKFKKKHFLWEWS